MGIRILVVEDEPVIADSLIRGLREESFAVEHAADGEAAWAALRSGGWDIVLLDWWLPGPDGRELLGRFRALDRHTPVLFLTARDAVADRVRGLDAGADDYLVKPFDFDELLARIRALIRRRDTGSGSTMSYRDLAVDLTSQRVERAGRPLELTAKEYALLVYFLRNSGRVLSRTRIYEHVWDERYDGLSNTLEVHVKELRRKLESCGPRLLHTLRGRGYMLGEPPGGPFGEAP